MNSFRRTIRIIFLMIITLISYTTPSWGFKLGTFNMEYFDINGKMKYEDRDFQYLSKIIKESNVDIIALQEVEGNKTMEYFTSKYMKGWSYIGIDTSRKQDLFFLWRKDSIESVGKPSFQLQDIEINWKGELSKLFSRPPLRGEFIYKPDKLNFTLINVHLKGLGTSGKENKIQAITFNNVKRQAQAVELTRLSKNIDGPVFILGDYNSVKLTELDMDSLELEGGYSYDELKCTIDHISFKNIAPKKSWVLYKVESSIPWKSKIKEHPDHDIIILDMR